MKSHHETPLVEPAAEPGLADFALDSGAIGRFVEEQLRPKVRNDGGDVTFEGLHGNTVRLVAYADCATCPATDPCLKWWVERELARVTGTPLQVVIEKRPPYFTR